MPMPKIKEVRAYTVRGGGADYHDQADGHWIDDHIATPMARYPEYRQSRQSFGINVLGTLVVEVEADDGTVGFAVTTAGEIGAFIVEKHLARFVEGRPVTDIEKIWDQMYFSTQYYGRKGVVLNTISGVDLALWDLLGKIRQEPVHQLLGGPVRDELVFYATGARPDLAKEMGFIGGQAAASAWSGRGRRGAQEEPCQARGHAQPVGDDFWLMFDCWMSLDLNYATRLAHEAHEFGLKWIEEALSPDDYWGYAELRRNVPPGHAGDDRRARGDPLGLPPAAGDGLLRHHPAGRELVRRGHRADQDFRAGGRARSADGPAWFKRLQLPLRDHAP